jgi:hypothetical protein
MLALTVSNFCLCKIQIDSKFEIVAQSDKTQLFLRFSSFLHPFMTTSLPSNTLINPCSRSGFTHFFSHELLVKAFLSQVLSLDAISVAKVHPVTGYQGFYGPQFGVDYLKPEDLTIPYYHRTIVAQVRVETQQGEQIMVLVQRSMMGFQGMCKSGEKYLAWKKDRTRGPVQVRNAPCRECAPNSVH